MAKKKVKIDKLIKPKSQNNKTKFRKTFRLCQVTKTIKKQN